MGRSAGKLRPLPHCNHVAITVVVSSLISLERSLPPRSTPSASLCTSRACFVFKQKWIRRSRPSAVFHEARGERTVLTLICSFPTPLAKFHQSGKGCQNRGRLRPNIHARHKSEPDAAKVKMSGGRDPSPQRRGLFLPHITHQIKARPATLA